MSTVRWKDQTTFYDPAEEESGNCTQAAVASLLDIPLDSVPDFKKEAGNHAYMFWMLFEDFLLEKGFWTIRKDTDSYIPEGYYLASGPSPRGVSHMIVMKEGEMVHDPHPSKEGIKEIKSIWILIPVDPSKHLKSEV